MPDYRYRALAAQGRIQKGHLSADTTGDLQLRLRQAGLTLIEATPARTTDWRENWQPVRLRDLAQFCRHAAQLEQAAVKLTDILHDISSSLPPSRLRLKLQQITHEVESGQRLSESLSSRPRDFPTPMPSLIAAGEASGRLGDSLSLLASHFDWHARLRSRLSRVLAYPFFALVAMIAVILFLLVYVIPETSQFLGNMQAKLPRHSQILLNIAAFTVHWGREIIAILFLTAISAILLYRRSNSVAYHFDRILLRLPLIGPFTAKLFLARFTKILSMLLISGIDLPPALITAGNTISNRAMRESVATIESQIDQGNAVSFAFQLSGIFPPLVCRMVMAGEESNSLPTALQHVAHYYEEDVQNAAEFIVTAIGPLITLVTGGLLIWLILAVFMPIYDALPQLI